MSGILALYGHGDDTQARRLLNGIRHRGPDGHGLLRLGPACLGHARLATLDLSGGAQPLRNEQGDLALALSGSIYNHASLRRELEAHHRFASRSDAEVALHLYESCGEAMLNRIDGPFALALASARGVLLARDPMGIQPLYFGRRGDTWFAASELKAFPPLDTLEMLPAGHAVRLGGKPWRYAPPFPPAPFLNDPDPAEMRQEIRRRLGRAVEKRLMGDAPVGVYLSGGLDSSVVAGLMRPHVVTLHSFTAGLAGAPDLTAARQVADWLGTDHHEFVYTEAELLRILPDVIARLESFDAPLVRSAAPMFMAARLAAEQVRVVLSGEGSDELFAGYSYLAGLRGDPLRNELAAILVGLQDTALQRADRMGAAHGLDTRAPFLDPDLVQYVFRLPAEAVEPRPDRPEKWLLREACRGLLPEAIRTRKKMKFSEGAGSAETVARHLASRISDAEFQRDRRVDETMELRSPEELFYYRIWRDAMPAHLSPRLVGRTRDRTAAATPPPTPSPAP